VLTLGIETSCDETAISVVDEGEVLSGAIASSVKFHKAFGGIIPEIASRSHVESISYVLKEALDEGGVALKDIELISVTQGPGLPGSLLVGIAFAKALALSLSVPLIGVNHVIAHLYANFMNGTKVRFPFVGLVVSGGHTSLIYAEAVDHYTILGQTHDDAAGEAFDKVAKIMNLGYPGGPIIEERAAKVKSAEMRFPRSYLGPNSLDFSFSGIKTSVLYYVRDHKKRGGVQWQNQINEICHAFQSAVCEVLINKAIAACNRKGADSLMVGGGVSANGALRKGLAESTEAEGISLWLSPKEMCTDNASMIAGFGEALYKKGVRSAFDITAIPDMGI